MDQTIMIGDIEESNLFDDLKDNKEYESDKVNLLKKKLSEMQTKHKAEIDAINLEQVTYKRIIQQMLKKLKQQQSVIHEQENELKTIKYL